MRSRICPPLYTSAMVRESGTRKAGCQVLGRSSHRDRPQSRRPRRQYLADLFVRVGRDKSTMAFVYSIASAARGFRPCNGEGRLQRQGGLWARRTLARNRLRSNGKARPCPSEGEGPGGDLFAKSPSFEKWTVSPPAAREYVEVPAEGCKAGTMSVLAARSQSPGGTGGADGRSASRAAERRRPDHREGRGLMFGAGGLVRIGKAYPTVMPGLPAITFFSKGKDLRKSWMAGKPG